VINEGAGTLAFGLSVLWIGGLVLVFFILCQYLSSSNFAFLLTLSVLAGIWQLATLRLMLTLQELNIPADQIVLQSIQTTLLFPLLWVAMLTAFKRWGQPRHVSP
jgi:hypothetical protein